MQIDISIHALREESDRSRPLGLCDLLISIHALREESDMFGYLCSEQLFRISIHALREESDRPMGDLVLCHAPISIHALREESDSKNREKTPCFCLIIHLSAQIAKRCL